MATTEIAYTVTGPSNKSFAYGTIATFDGTTINDSDILKVFHNGVEITFVTDYTVDEINENVNIAPAYPLVTSDSIIIKRETNIGIPFVNFENNTQVDANDLDLAILQLLYAAQERETQADNTLTYDIVGDCWDAQGRVICDVKAGSNSTDGVNLGQVLAIISGGEVADTGDGVYDQQNGDDVNLIFLLPLFPTTDVNAAKLFVTIDGVVQKPGDDYSYGLSVSSVPTVTFTVAPPTGTDNVQFRALPGVVTTTYDAESIDGSSIITNTLPGDRVIAATLDGDTLIDATVTASKMGDAAGAVDRFIVFDAAGDASLRIIDNTDITNVGAVLPEDVTTTLNTVGTASYTYTNNTGKAVFLMLNMQVFSNTATVTYTPDGEAGITMATVGGSSGVVLKKHISFFVSNAGVVTTSAGSIVISSIVQEI